jgi:hypothetical protein
LAVIAEYGPDLMIEPDGIGVHEDKTVMYPVGAAENFPSTSRFACA